MSLTSTVEELMTPRLLGRMASESGLSETKVKNGLGGAAASIFGGLAGKASDQGVMNRVADLVSASPDVDVTSALDDTSPLKGPSNQLLGIATGDSSSLTSRIASMLGIGGKAAGGLVAAASSLAIAAFKRIGRGTGGLDANKLANTLIDERQEINARLPAGMATTTATTATTATAARARPYDRGERVDSYAQHEEVERSPSRAWWWLVALIPLALLAYWLFTRSRTRVVNAPASTPPAYRSDLDRTNPDTMRPQRVVPPPTSATPPATTPPTATGVAPPNGAEDPSTTNRMNTQPGATDEGAMNQPGSVPTPPSPDTTDQPQHPGATPMSPNAGPRTTEPSAQLDFPAGSVESRFLAHVKSPTGNDESTWFELDQVTFATGKANLEAASQEQIKNVADILKANPDVRVRVGGVTDEAGAGTTDQRLPQQRAESIKQALVAQGVDADRIDTQARGDAQQGGHAAIRVQSRH
jgi:outer membrane protein OmpA-like peptidoglycan-associated protein